MPKGLDAGVFAVRDMLIGRGAAYYLTCAGDRVMECKGCMDGESRFDDVVLTERAARGAPSGRNVFTARRNELDAAAAAARPL